jgi:hypothetical protein
MNNKRAERIRLVESLRENDLIRWNGKLRVIRGVTPGTGTGYRRISFSFSILRCSWTRRPFTTYTRTDLQDLKRPLELVARNYKDKTVIGQLVNKDIQARSSAPSVLECCDVVGVIK